MKRRAFLTGCVALLATRHSAAAQQRGKPASIGWLSFGNPERGPEDWRPGFESYLRQMGWEPRVDPRYARGDSQRHGPAELAQSNVVVIVATDTTAAQAGNRHCPDRSLWRRRSL
jgi:hypothetical protein